MIEKFDEGFTCKGCSKDFFYIWTDKKIEKKRKESPTACSGEPTCLCEYCHDYMINRFGALRPAKQEKIMKEFETKLELAGSPLYHRRMK